MLDSLTPTTSASARTCDTSATSETAASPSNGTLFGGDKACNVWARLGLTWIEQPGIGFYPVHDTPYDRRYFDKYVGYAHTEIGRRLNAARIALVARHYHGQVVDIGIGCGQFVQTRPATFGYDVNPAGIEWLRTRQRFVDPYARLVKAATFWDSLEHIRDPGALLVNVTSWAFVAIPIFRNLPHVLRSKHFRPDEHFWYFTERGFVTFMGSHGFELVERNMDETTIGREDILSYAFRRAAR
jgi:hypothetical protein